MAIYEKNHPITAKAHLNPKHEIIKIISLYFAYTNPSSSAQIVRIGTI